MARKSRYTCKDIEYMVKDPRESAGAKPRYFRSSRDAFAHAARIAAMHGQSTLDVLVFSRAGARCYGGSEAVELFDVDPEASSFERFIFEARSQGRIP